ncbi:MAG: galactokinase [Flavitalea sp.]
MMIRKIRQQFADRFHREPMLVTAPGRVNLIGEHTDYNDGFVLPGAIDKKIYFAIAKNGLQQVRVWSNEFQELFSFPLDRKDPDESWKNYLIGVNYYIQLKTGAFSEGVDIVFDGDIPVGGGMSSSAALCSGYGFALNELFSRGLDRLELARIGQLTEHHFVGANVGIMDQFASLYGKAGHVIKLDCRSMEYEYIPFHFPDHRIVLVNSMVKHTLAASEYNVRRQQCEEGVAKLKKYYPEALSLRDISIERLEKHILDIPEIVYQRCKYVVEEKDRLLKGCELLKQGNLAGFGSLMYRTHEGLRHEYEVSCKELDFLVECAKKIEGVEGSRMMGGGFGGCTINLVQLGAIGKFTAAIQEQYRDAFEKTTEVYTMQIEDGVKEEAL